MTRFKKEMISRYPHSFEMDEYGEVSAYVIEEKALVVFCHPSITLVYQFLRNGEDIEVTEEYPEITDPWLVHLCNGDIERAKNILKGTRF